LPISNAAAAVQNERQFHVVYPASGVGARRRHARPLAAAGSLCPERTGVTVTGAGRKVQAGWRYPRDLGPWPPACPPGRLSAYVAARTFIRRRWFDASVSHALGQDGFRDPFRRPADRPRAVRLRVVSPADGSLDTDNDSVTVVTPGQQMTLAPTGGPVPSGYTATSVTFVSAQCPGPSVPGRASRSRDRGPADGGIRPERRACGGNCHTGTSGIKARPRGPDCRPSASEPGRHGKPGTTTSASRSSRQSRPHLRPLCRSVLAQAVLVLAEAA